MTMKSVAAVAMATIGIASAPVASAAYPTTGKLGSQLTMVDSVGQVTLNWTVSNLQPSSAVMADYPVAGKLWQATAPVTAASGPVPPAISQFNAVAPNQA